KPYSKILRGALHQFLLYPAVGANALSPVVDEWTIHKNHQWKISVNVLSLTKDGVFINNAKVTVADVLADNGVVHVLDAVLLPPVTVADVINSPIHNTA
ncbi:MAG: fasciclin domain-containing protein, partial [Saprospiraceae bacterium]|nr:fasciclin domain-containing protein [Candidatus Vicinibacter affinis]